MNRLVLRDVPKATLGYDAFELAVAGGFRGLRNVPPGFHRVEVGGVALDVVIDRGVASYALRGDRFEPAPSPLDAAAAAGDLDHALFDVAQLPAAPAQAWRTLTSQLRRPEDVAAWRTVTGWDDARAIAGLQAAWLAMNHAGDAAAARWLAALLAEVGPLPPARAAALLDQLAAIRVLGGARGEALADDVTRRLTASMA